MNNQPPKFSRRDFATYGATALAGLGAASVNSASAQSAPGPELKSEFLLELLLDTEPAMNAGTTNITPVSGGSFSGPRLKGTVLPGGADWVTKSPNGDIHLNVRITLQTDDEQLIYMSYTGLIHRSMKTGATYWRVRPVFETASEKYDFLNHMVAVGVSKQVRGKVAYDIHEIL